MVNAAADELTIGNSGGDREAWGRGSAPVPTGSFAPIGLPAAMVWAVAAALSTAQPVQAQSNLDAGKSPAQIFADTCSACHKSPREIKRTTAAFMREHYTTGNREAAAMAAYLASVGSDAGAVSQRKPPVLGAGRAAPAENARSAAPAQPAADQPKPETQAALPGTEVPKPPAAVPRARRPSESVEIGLPASTEAAPGAQAAPSPGVVGEFEE